MCRRDAVREALADTIEHCGLSREALAAEMSRLTGDSISRTHIDQWTAPSKSGWRFPLEYAAALAAITGDCRVVEAALAGTRFRVVDERTVAAAELGRMVAEERRRRARMRELLEVV
jgi:hypothetical protein